MAQTDRREAEGAGGVGETREGDEGGAGDEDAEGVTGVATSIPGLTWRMMTMMWTWVKGARVANNQDSTCVCQNIK